MPVLMCLLGLVAPSSSPRNKNPKNARMKNPTCTVVLSNLSRNRTNVRTASLRNSGQRLPKNCIKALQSICGRNDKSPYGYASMNMREQ